ncbi:MAG: hypothetical protein ACJ74W_20215 [Pyrinomonadaceae bacterium]
MDNVTTFLAWWGAIVSTVVIVWDVYKWRKTGHPKLIVRANGNFQDAHSVNPQKYIAIKITNVGDKPTTLSLITFRYYKTKPSKWRKQEADKRGFFQPLRPSAPLPYKLEVGTEWSAMIYQTEELEEMAREGYFYVEAEDTSTLNAIKNSRSRLLIEQR